MSNDSINQGQQSDELQTEDWAGEMGLKWLASLSLFEGMIAPIGDALLARADFQSGETVIDLGCGGGATTLAIAGAVAPSGKVMGVDISPDLVAAAQERAASSGATNVEFTCADASVGQLPDVCRHINFADAAFPLQQVGQNHQPLWLREDFQLFRCVIRPVTTFEKRLHGVFTE